MKQRVIYFLSAGVTLLVFSQVAANAAEDSKVEQAVRKLEEQRVEAQVRGDFPTLERLMSDDFTYTHSSGETQAKGEFLADLKSGKRVFKSVKHEDVRVRVYGSTAVLTGRSNFVVVNGGKELDLPLRFIGVYVKRNGDWQMVAWQSTKIAP